ncbi:MAG TPA: NACHT domain-containing protein, partial [Ktedonobacteraceae bacterium]
MLTDPQAVAAIIAAIITTAATIAIAVLPGVIRHIRHRHEDGKQRPGDMQQHVKHYCENLQQSPRIVQLQVLDMPQPVNIKDVYVQLRVYTNQWLSYKLDEDLRQAEIEQDPASLIAAVKHSQEQRLQEEIDINQAIRQYRHIVIVGDPGVGKTTLLKHLTIKSTRGELWECPRIPIYLELSMFNTDMYTNLLDLVVEQWHQYDDMPDTMLRSYLEQAMDKGDILLLIDGLDETAVGSSKEQSEQAYMHTLRSIQVLVDRFPRTHVIVTVRKATYRSQYWPRLQGFNEMEIGEFTSDAIHKFIRNWFEAANIDNAERFIRDLTSLLRRNSRLEELASNPLLLSLIVVVYKQHLELPENRAMLYERCVATILTRWDAMRSKIRRRIFQTDHKLMLCKEIAWHFHENGMRYFPENELLDVIARFLPTINLEPDQNREILDEIMQVHGLIKAQAQNLYGFSHMTFQEYFAALYIKDGLHGNGQSLLDTLIAHVDKSWWEEVLQLYASITPDAGPLLEKLLEHCQSSDLCESLFHTNLLRAGRCLETNPVVKDNQLRERIVDQLFSILQATPYASLQREIAITLTRIGGRAVNQRLLQMLSPIPQKTINLEISTHIADALGHSSDQRVTSSLLTLLNNKQVNQQVRAHVALALGQLGEYYPHVRKNILAQLTDMEEDWYVRLRL